MIYAPNLDEIVDRMLAKDLSCIEQKCINMNQDPKHIALALLYIEAASRHGESDKFTDFCDKLDKLYYDYISSYDN